MRVLKALVYVIVFGVLLYTVVLSGYHYRYDADELFNANTIYLMIKGMRPYADFYTVYSPLLHWFLIPVFWLYGFTFAAVNASRMVMILLFLIRLVLSFFLVKKVFGRRVAYFFIPLFLLDPFTVFAAMQIRPENLMMVFYTGSLLVFSIAWENKKSKLFFLAGLLLGFAFIVNLKIIPSLIAFWLVFVFYGLAQRRKENMTNILHVVNGFCLTIIGFIVYFVIKGYAPEMFLHVFLDPFRLNNAILYPTTLNYFYFSNPVIYGFEGKPTSWLYALLLPVLAFAGGYGVFLKTLKEQKTDIQSLVKMILFVSFIIQWLSMPFINSVFIQYYIPLSWFYTLFVAVLIDDVLFVLPISRLLRNALMTVTFVFFVILFITSIFANIARSKMDSRDLIVDTESLWKRVPDGTYTFPNLIFRPPVYPVLWGSTFAPYMRDRYKPVYKALEEKKVAILTGLDDTYFSYLDSESRSYIAAHYIKDSTDNRFWILKK